MFLFGNDDKDSDKAAFFNMYLVDPASFWQEFEGDLRNMPEAKQEFIDWLHSEVRKRKIDDLERQHMKDLLAEIYERGHRIQNPQDEEEEG